MHIPVVRGGGTGEVSQETGIEAKKYYVWYLDLQSLSLDFLLWLQLYCGNIKVNFIYFYKTCYINYVAKKFTIIFKISIKKKSALNFLRSTK